MRVRLGVMQYRYMERLCEGPIAEHFAEDAIAVGVPGRAHIYDVGGAFIAWEILLERCVAKAYSATGGRKEDGISATLAKMIRNIAKETNRITVHPAMRGAAMLGLIAEAFPAWEDGDQWSPTPNGNPFVYLKPQWHTELSPRLITTWGPLGQAPPDRLASEAVHLALAAHR